MSSNLFMQVPVANTGVPLSPPLSPGSNLFKNLKSSLVPMSNSKNEKSFENSHEKQIQQNVTEVIKSKPKNKYRMRICDAPPELLELIKRSEKMKSKPTTGLSRSISSVSSSSSLMSSSSSLMPSSSSSFSSSSSSLSSSSISSNDQSYHKIITPDEKRHRFRKNPYPKKAPSKSSPGITLQVDVYTTLKEDPKALLRRNNQSTSTSITSSTSSLFTDSSSGTDSSPPQSPTHHRPSPKKQVTKTKTRTKRTKPTISERKRKGNSLARVMADRGLLESNLTSVVTTEIKPIRIPPPPPMQFDELMKNIEQLNLDLTILQRVNPKINWKGQPLSISHLPHYGSLHSKEAHVASTLRLTPVQYLTAKHTLISSARRYVQKSLPFRKSDAQKLLRIDVNKASKLWEFFMQVKWI